MKGVRSLERGLQMLELFDQPGKEHTVQDLAQALDIPLPSAYRLVNTLVDRGYLARDRARGPLRLGLSLIRLGCLAQQGLDLREKARPALEKMASTTGETAVLVRAAVEHIVCIDKIEGTSPIRPDSLQVGEYAPYTAGAIALVILAYLDHARRQELLRAELPAVTPATLVKPEAIEERCERIRQNGYDYSVDEVILGTAAIAAPIFGPGGDLLGGLGITGIAERMESFEDTVIEAAADVSASMGYHPH